MKELEFICIGDLHLEKLQRIFTQQDTITMQLEHAQRAVNYAISHGIKYAVLLGDIFDTPYPQQTSVRKFLSFLKNNKQINWRIILGNHDFASNDDNSLEVVYSVVNSFKELSHVKVYTKPTLEEIDNFSFAYMPFPNTVIPKTKKPSICFGHIEMQGAIHDNGMKIKEGVVKLNKKDYWIIGHLHRYQVFNRIMYPGTMLQLSFGEPNPKGFVHCTARIKNKQLKVIHKRIVIDTPYKFENVYLEQQENVDKFIKDSKNKENTYYKLFVNNEIILPHAITKDNNTVLKIVGYKNEKELRTLQNGKLDTNIIESKLDITYGLLSFLKSKKLSKEKRKKAVKLIKRIAKEA